MNALLTSAADLDADPTGSGLLEIAPESIRPNPEQPRTDFGDAEIDALAESIREHGLLQPLVVRRVDGGYQLVAGERRLRAAKRAGLSLVPAVVRESEGSDRESLELALVENLLRQDLNPIEEAQAYARLADAFGLSHEAIALRLHRSRSAVSNAVRLLSLPVPLQKAVAAGRISAGHARAMLALPDVASQILLAGRVLEQGLSVRETERQVRKELEAAAVGSGRATRRDSSVPSSEASRTISPDDAALAHGFEDALGLPVELRRRQDGSGQLLVSFAGDEDLDALYRRVGAPDL